MNIPTAADTRRQIINVIAFIATVIVNALSTALPLNGRSPEEISDELFSYFTPASFAFSIWGVIYLGLLGFIIYQALPAQRTNPHLRKIGNLFALTAVANIAWIFSWHWGFYGLSVIFMAALLVVLLMIYTRLGIGLPNALKQSPRTRADTWLIHIPFSLYTAWITVATVANTASVLGATSWNGFGIAGPVWAAIMILVAAVITLLVLVRRTDVPYAAVIVWAVYAISVKQADESIIVTTAYAAIVLVVAAALLGVYLTSFKRRTQSA